VTLFPFVRSKRTWQDQQVRTVLPLLLALGLTVALTPVAPPASAPTPADKCVKYWGEARYAALGYNHLVHVANACAVAADCVVSTDVNPEPQSVTVGGRSEVIVSTFLGSPARTFAPRVKCVMREN
jgi:hypothetical protein